MYARIFPLENFLISSNESRRYCLVSGPVTNADPLVLPLQTPAKCENFNFKLFSDALRIQVDTHAIDIASLGVNIVSR